MKFSKYNIPNKRRHYKRHSSCVSERIKTENARNNLQDIYNMNKKEEVEIGAIYNDPEGTFKVISGIDSNNYVDVQNIETGKVYSVPEEEVRYFITMMPE